jgi:chitin-binding protein
VSSRWGTNFQADVRVTAGSTGTSRWNVTLTYPSAVSISNSWNATMTPGSTVAATNVGHNGQLSANSSTTFGFIGSGPNATPTLSCSAS